ncbi:MAG TPA: class II aldolase/adducin family protein [Anaerolineaceae bacterium]|jgi:L-ribulose-5-phosphate 4-epimerase|nr:class II aldolase/adducin family protein [Anaerolineaceae bacterium]
MRLEELRNDVLKTARDLAKYGLVWMAGGTACARDVHSGLVAVTPSGLDYADLHAEDVVLMDLQGEVIEGHHKPSCASELWLRFFRKRKDLNAIVHTHSCYATAFSVVNQPIPIITETQADWFGEPIPVAPYAHVEDDAFLHDPVEALGNGYGVLLGRHGVLTFGKNLRDALERALTLEEAAKTFIMAKTIGTPEIFSVEEARRSFDFYHTRYGQPGRKGT